MSATEREIKLQVPDEALAAVRKRVATASSVRTRLQAVYFDTADGDLAQAGLALRLRREGRQWVQTLKGSAAEGRPLERAEHNVLRSGSAEPVVDPALHADTSTGQQLIRILGSLDPVDEGVPVLRELFRTDILRTHRLHRLKGGSVEWALDEGCIRSGSLEWPVQELEIEHRGGHPQVVMDAAALWIQDQGLWIDTRSKAERGHRLWRARLGRAWEASDPRVAGAQSASLGLKQTGVPLDLEEGEDGVPLQAVLLGPLLPALLANASDLAGGTGTDEHVHQLRVSIRRLRSVVRLGERWLPTWPEPVMQAIVELFRRLGEHRDRGVVEREFGPALRLAGCPLEGRPSLGADSPLPDLPGSLRAPALNLAWLWLLRAASDPLAVVPGEALATGLHERLERWSEEIAQLAKRFERLDEPAQHELRKRIKRLRYALDSTAMLHAGLAPRPRREYVQALGVSQAALGEFCDLLTARDVWRASCEHDPRAWFAVGWISAELTRMQPAVAKTLRRYARIDKRWRHAEAPS